MIDNLSMMMLEKIDKAISLNDWRYHVQLNENYSYCKLTGVLWEGSDYSCCKDKRYAEFITANILKHLDTFSDPWIYISQFKHKNLRSRRSGNDFYPFDFAGIKLLPEVDPKTFIPDWVLEVNEKNGHFEKADDGYIYIMKPSDYLKWEFCIKHRIPLFYLNVPNLDKKKELSDEELYDMIADLKVIMGCINGYIVEKRSTTDKTKIEEYFIKHFCELPYNKIVLNEEEFKKTPHLIETCNELIQYNQEKLKDYVRAKYFN